MTAYSGMNVYETEKVDVIDVKPDCPCCRLMKGKKLYAVNTAQQKYFEWKEGKLYIGKKYYKIKNLGSL